ncbi:hypothetical protein [Neobacillus sp. DY30]|uniref:hypothetical protein n=1 Tax=Neobacillus sp. DY30 TaxID=3047871 RepID=UPI0024C09107|nr:hypothetical protein [Neobacillus sp. DY30]WHX99908.1 hypothetical protein QNH29_25650 [Neobacillus sp. DY30]
MCAPINFIEQQATEMYENIRKSSIYKLIRVDYSVANNQKSQSGAGLITQVVLEDNEGNVYFVEPNSFGVRFAKGEITYKEYKKFKKRETLNAILLFLGIIVFFSGLMIILMKNFA